MYVYQAVVLVGTVYSELLNEEDGLSGVDTAAILTTLKKLNIFAGIFNGPDNVKDVSYTNIVKYRSG